MKPTSKKDWYIVLCENSKETTIVKNKTCNRNEKSWFDYKYVVKSKQHFPSEMLWDHIPDSADHLPVISFEEWQSLPDEPKPEYDPKDVAFKNDVYSNYEFNSEKFETKCGHVYTEDKKLIGYKLIKEEYWESVIFITGYIVDKLNSDETNKKEIINWMKHDTAGYANNLKKAGVLDLWFEPVYQDESITLKSGKVLTASEIEEVKEILKKI